MKYNVTTSFLPTLFSDKQGPFVSVYFDTTPFVTERSHHQIKLKNSISQLKKHNVETHFTDELSTLLDDMTFWDQLRHGCVILMNQSENYVYFLEKSVPTMVKYGDQPYLLPLIHHFQQVMDVQCLLLNREEFKLYEGTFLRLHKMDFPTDDPITSKEVLGTETSERYFSNAPSGRMQGDDGKSTLEDVDMERYFNYVDKYVYDNISKHSKLPLILVALPEYHPVFRDISQNEFLFKHGIKMDWSRFSTDTLENQLETLMRPHVRDLTKDLRNRFKSLQANGQASDFTEDVIVSILEQRGETLMINKQSTLNGLLNTDDHTFLLDEHRTNDLRNELALLALNAKTKVLVLDEDEMPTTQPMAVITRY